MDEEYAEYRCTACKKEIKSLVVTCKSCVKLFFHAGCVNKHKIYDKNREYVSCLGPFEKFTVGSDTEVKKTPIGRDRAGSIGSAGSSGSKTVGVSGPVSMETKIDWLVRTMREMKDEIVCKREIKILIKEAVQEEMKVIKQEMEDLRKMIRGGMHASAEDGHSSYSGAVKKKKKIS